MMNILRHPLRVGVVARIRTPRNEWISPRQDALEDRQEAVPPTADDMIKIHYKKHYPNFEFNNKHPIELSPFQLYLHGRHDYLGTMTSPMKQTPGQMVPPFAAFLFVIGSPLLILFLCKNCGDAHQIDAKNMKQRRLGVFTQVSF